jgi:hypothetical protein
MKLLAPSRRLPAKAKRAPQAKQPRIFAAQAKTRLAANQREQTRIQKLGTKEER